MRLGVNVDHVATLRQARGTAYPSPAVAALLAEYAGCDSIVVHLREDRRHIKEKDVILIKKTINVSLNLEMSINQDVVDFALDLMPNQATLVPERRQELTTEGGIDLRENTSRIEKVVAKLKDKGIKVSLFINPVKCQVNLAGKIAADLIEFNTGKFSESKTTLQKRNTIGKLKQAVVYAGERGFLVAAGHGLDYDNVKDIVKIKGIEELNIGHSIISRAVFLGIVAAVEEMIDLAKR